MRFYESNKNRCKVREITLLFKLELQANKMRKPAVNYVLTRTEGVQVSHLYSGFLHQG